MRHGAKRLLIGLVFAVAVTFLHQNATSIPIVDLGSAADFAVLAGAGITVIGGTTITGDIGTYSTTTITGLENLVLHGTNHAGDAVTQQAKIHLASAYSEAAGRVPDITYAPIFDLGGRILGSGVYRGSSSFGITGALTLDAHGDPTAVWVFQTGTTLVTASGSTVLLANGAQADHVFWQVGSSATLGDGSVFVGSILALESITLNSGVTVDGRLLAQIGAVSLSSGAITVPEPCTLFLLGPGLIVATLFAPRRRLLSRTE